MANDKLMREIKDEYEAYLEAALRREAQHRAEWLQLYPDATEAELAGFGPITWEAWLRISLAERCTSYQTV